MVALLAVLVAAAPLHVNTQLERTWLPESTGGEVYLQIDLAADASAEALRRVPVNAVMILDRSGSMAGMKIERAREAARALVRALGPRDRFAIVDFSNGARVLVPSTEATAAAKETALGLISGIRADGGTNLSAAFEAAAPQLSEGRAEGRVDKVFVASDGQANQGIFARPALLALALSRFGAATVSTFGIGEDYDEQFMTRLAVQAGGRARYVSDGSVLARAFEAELSRAASTVARDVRLDLRPFKKVSVLRVLGFDAQGGSVRLPDIAAGDERRVMVKLSVPPGRGTAELTDIELTWRDARGERQKVTTSAQAQYTADARKLEAQKPNPITWQGTLGEMADAAGQALRYQAENRPDLAKKEQERVQQLGAQAASIAPAPVARVLNDNAAEYTRRLQRSGAGVQSERKALSADVSEAASAPAKF